jgi:hypothetical protein
MAERDLKRKFGPPRARPGQLKVQWGKIADHDPDLVYARGEGVPSADGWLFHDALTSPNWKGPLSRDKFAFDPSLLEELEARGYDIKTLKISIEKKRTDP